MKGKFGITVVAVVLGASAMSAAQAYDGDWKRGRIYYRQICTTCHTAELKKPIAPNDRTMSEWAAYFQANKHGKGTVNSYFSKQYRDGIKSKNPAAAKYADVPEQDLIEDVKAFVHKSAKDGDAPAGCN